MLGVNCYGCSLYGKRPTSSILSNIIPLVPLIISFERLILPLTSCVSISMVVPFNDSQRAILYSSAMPHTVSLVMSSSLCDSMDCSPPGSSVHGIFPARIPECHFLLQGIFPTQGSNPHLLCLLHCRSILHLLSHWGSRYISG